MTATTLDTDIVFVFGALRSGTTVFRLMLNAHPDVTNPGEADFLFDHISVDPDHPTGWRYDRISLGEDRIFRDRGLVLPARKDGADLLEDLLLQLSAVVRGKRVTLNVHRHAERLRALLPRARIIHLLRDPRDVARSSIGMGWAGTLWHGVDHWIATENSWGRAVPGLAPDQVLTLDFETLMTELEDSLRKTCAFLAVPYSTAMLDYHRETSYGPPDAALASQWRRRADPRDIMLLEGKAGQLMRSRGYNPTGPGRTPSTLERLALTAKNKAGVWRFGIRRFGPVTFFSEKLARRLGFDGARRRLQRHMDVAVRQHLK